VNVTLIRYKRRSGHIKDDRFRTTNKNIIRKFRTTSTPLAITMSWNDDVSYAMAAFKLFTLPIGGWPLQEYNMFALVRYVMSCCGMVRFQFLS